MIAAQNFLDNALAMAARGVPVTPLKPNTKIAFQTGFPDLATTDADAIARLAEEFPTANVGAVARDHAFVDWDLPELRAQAEKEMGQPIPSTLTVRTPGRGGWHDYFKHTERSRAIGNLHREHSWELRARRQYVVAPGSTINGKQYTVANDAPIADFPEHLLDWLVANAETEKRVVEKSPDGARAVAASFEFEDFLEHYGLEIEDTRGDWHELDICPVAGRKHDNSRATGFRYDGKTLGFKCFANDCPGSRMTVGEVVQHMNKPNGTKFHAPYGGDIWTDSTAPAASLAEALKQFNEHYCYVNCNHAVVQLSNRMVMRAMEFRGAHAANKFANRVTKHEDGSAQVVKTPVAKAWIEWPERRQVEQMVYEPGKPEFFGGDLNRWLGWGCEPKAGDTAPWNNLLDSIFHGDSTARTWFEQWCAYPLQRPGVKLANAVILWGSQQGTGKTTVGETLRKIYGSNAALIREEHLHAAFNDWSADKQFILADEITGSGDKRAHADRLKLMVTGSSILVNKKFEPTYTLRDSINYLFTSNHCDAFFLEDTDRRYFVWEVNGAVPPAGFFDHYYAWLNDGGPAALFSRLLRLDLAGFQPFQAPPRTSAKEEMIELGWSELDRWVRQAIADPAKLIAKGGNVWTAGDLLKEYRTDTLDDRVKQKGMAGALKRAGLNSRRVQARGVLATWCYTLNPAEWDKKDTREWAAEYAAHRLKLPDAAQAQADTVFQ